MRRPENQPIDPVTQAELDAIDATLRGDAVDPVYAELAEIALLLEAERPPAPRQEFADRLDARVALRFETAPASSSVNANRERVTRSRSVFDLLRHPAVVLSTLAAAAVVAVAVFVLPNLSSPGSNSSASSNSTGGPALGAGSSGGASSSRGVSSGKVAAGNTGGPSVAGINAGGHSAASGTTGRSKPSSGVAGTPSHSGAPFGPSTTPSRAATSNSSTQAGSVALGTASAPAASSSGRKVEQSTQIQLSTGNSRIDTVSQELFNLASAENTIVERSHVSTAAGNNAGSFATFTLSVPDANLQAMMDRLSSLRYANVVSRQQSTTDVTDQYNDDKRALADAQALRTSLLTRLEAAFTTGAIDSLKAQIHTAETQIRGAENQLNRLDHATSYTTVSVQINAANAPVAKSKSSSGFSVSRGAHDGLRVLVVAAGIALIVLAALIPLSLLVALLAWIGFWVRQRRREHALDQP